MANDFLNRLPNENSNRYGTLGGPASPAVQPQQQRVAKFTGRGLPRQTLGLQQQRYDVPQQQAPQQQSTLQQAGQAIQQGLTGVQQLAAGESPYLDILEQKYLGRTAAAGAARGAAQGQRALGLGLDPTVQRALEQEQRRQGEMALGQVRGDIGEQRARGQEAAQSQLAGLGMQVSQFERAQKEKEFETLLGAGGASNIEQATKIYEEMYGSQLDPYLAQQQSMTKVLGQFASMPGVTPEQALSMAKEQGALEHLGISEQEAKAFLDPIMLGANPLAQAKAEYGTMLSQGLITPDQYNDAMMFSQWMLTNHEGIEMKDSFAVYDKEGKEVGNFLSKEEAETFVSKSGEEYQIKESKYIGHKGEYEEFTGREEGEYFVEGENVYKIQEGKKIITEPDYADPFSVQNTKFLELGEDNKYYKKLLGLQVKAAIAKPEELPLDFEEGSVLYQNLIKSPLLQHYTLNDLRGRETGSGHKSVVEIPQFEGLNANSLIIFQNKVFMFQSKHHIVIKGDDDVVEYRLYDPATGETKVITTDRDSSNVHIK